MPQPSGNLKHKETNTFRFKTFSEKLTEINVRSNLFKISTRKRDDEESTVTEAMEKWSKLDLTQQHVDFRRAISRKWRNFALVTHNFGDIVQALEKHLQLKDTLALQSLLEILVATCEHDPEEFYAHFSKFFKILVGLLSTQDSQKIEWTFTCMAQLFQYLRKPMVKDLDNVLDLYISLFTGTRPAHISTFASQSVSFLLHKASNYKQVLSKLFTVFSDPFSSTEGMAKVLLEVVKSPKSRFHSCTAAFLPVLYSFLDGGDETGGSEQIVACILHSCKLMTMHTRREHGGVLLEAILHRCMEKNDLVGLRHSLLLLRTFCEVQQGSRVTDLNQVFACFNNALAVSVKNADAELRAEVCSLAACFLKCDKASIEKEKRNSLVESISNAGYSFDETARFWRLLYKTNDVANEFAVRQMLRYCQRAIQDSQKHTAVVGLLLDRCLEQQGLPDNADELNSYEPPALLFRQIKENDVSIGSAIKGLLKSADLRTVWEALVLATRAKPVSRNLSSDALEVAERCLSADNVTSGHIAVAVAALQLICFLNKKADKIDFKSVPESLRKFVEEDRVSKHFLFCLDVVIEKCPLSKEKFSKDEDLKKWLVKNLSSSNLTISSLILRILRNIDGGEDTPIYQHLIQAVDTPNTVHDYRARFIHLRKVDAIQGSYRQLSGFKKQAVIRILFSHFYINFSAVWQPAREVILSFSTESKKDEFWQILMDELVEAFENAKNSRWWIKTLKRKHQDETEDDDGGHYTDFLKSDNFHIAQAAKTKADYFNYRLELLKTVSTLPHSSTVEGWNRRLSELLFAYLKDEYAFVDSYSSASHDLADARQSSDLDEVVCRRKDAVRTLVAIMSIFARFRNIKAAADEDKLLEFYQTFLTHSDTTLQRVSLECLLTYKNKSLVANKDKLFEFFDDKKFRDALTTFDIKEMTEETREGVVPTLLRLLYGRMRSCTGRATLGKAHAPLRRSIVIRFIAGLDRHYTLNFFNMIATPYKEILDGGDSVLESVQNAKAKAKASGHAVPVKKQLGFLGSVNTLLSKLNKDMPVEVYTRLYRVLLCIIASSVTLIDADELVNRRHVAGLRSLKKVAAECLLNLMAAWSDQSILSSDQVDALFEVREFYPALNKLVNENISSPTIELKLFMCFCKRVRYLPLLAKSIEGRGYTSVADALVSLLVSGKPSPPVNGVIIEALNNALTATNSKDGDDDDVETPLSLQQCSAAVESVGEMSVSLTSEQLMQPSAFSLELLKPSIGRVVKFFADRLRDKPTGVTPNELKLISIFSEHVDESCKETLEQLSKILIQHALKACGSQRINWKAITSSLETLYHVMRTPNLLFHLSPLFSKVRDREARAQLVLVFQRACEGSPHLKWTSEQVVALNKWDERRVDEIDFDARLIAFNNVVEVLKSDSKFASLFKDNCVTFLPIFQTCLYTLLHHSDNISLRDNVARVFENTIARIKQVRTTAVTDIDGESVYRLLIRELLLAILQKGVRSILSVVRRESIRALGLVVRTFPDEPTLQGLSAMVNETNPDDDSFECLIHIQLHRQARALREFSRHICPERDPEHTGKVVEKVARSSALRYILPYVCQEIYTVTLKKDCGYYREVCLDLIKSCCTVMTWSQLKRFLVQTAKSIEKKPLALEILRASLDAFPFDLSLADDIITDEDEKKEDEVEEEKEADEEAAADAADDQEEEEVEEDKEEEEVTMETDQDMKGQSQKIINDLITTVLPLLRRVLTRKMADEDSHKLARQHTPIEQCKSRLPLAIAMVSMLIKCPPNILKAQLCSVVHKIVDYLRHKQFQIREAARDSLCKCVALLGPVYLLTVLKVLHSELQRGFQKHVLVRTCCSLLSTLSPKLQAGDLNDSLSLLLEILLDDLFGRLGEDKKVDEVRAKIPEAKGRSRVYGALRFISASVSCDCLVTLISPFRHQAERTNQHNIKKVIHDSLSEISQGLIENIDLEPVDYLTLVQNLLTDENGDLFAVKQTQIEEKKFVQKPGMRPQSCYLLNKTVGRIGKKPIAKNSKSNLHLLIEFALQLCHLTIKRGKVVFKEHAHLELLDPLVEPLAKCLHAPNRQTIVSAMRCLQRLFRAELPAMEARMDSISKRLFKIVQEHSQDRLGDTETAMLSFKSLSVLCQSDYGEILNATQLQTLLVFAETDMNDTERQSHAFDLIKAILKRGLKNDDVADVMRRIRKISIQAHSMAARNQARNLYVFYLIAYRKEMKHTQVARHVEFALEQFEYEGYETGRLSAMELISSLITDYPENVIAATYAPLIFSFATTMMKNDESTQCRKMAAMLVKLLLNHIEDKNRDDLLTDVLQWYKSDEVARQQLGAMVVPLFAQFEGVKLQRRLDEVLEVVSSKLVVQPHREDDDEDDVRDKDHSLILHLSCSLSILQNCNVLNNTKWNNRITDVLERTHKLLLHPHDWIRFVSTQILGFYLRFYLTEENKPEVYTPTYDLTKKFCRQLGRVPFASASMGAEVLQNIQYMMHIHDKNKEEDAITMILKDLVRLAKNEQASRPKVIEQRTIVIKFCEYFTINYSSTPVELLELVLDPVQRAINATATHGEQEIDSINELRDLGNTCMEEIKKKVGIDVFTEVYAKVTQDLSVTRRERRMKRAQLVVTDPVLAANMKIKKQERTKAQRKRKFRPELTVTKKPKNDE